ncbi:hypothetical protein B0H14DRAFT_2797907 [Mycena olivaceomarginata]|nr:hypothetical protein B0H14DRAFT_2797907 [Mycena olivaceomarginata]
MCEMLGATLGGFLGALLFPFFLTCPSLRSIYSLPRQLFCAHTPSARERRPPTQLPNYDELRQHHRPNNRVVLLQSPPTPSPRCRCPPRWSVAYDVPGGPSTAPRQRAQSTPPLLRCQRRALMFLSRPHARHHAGANLSSACATSCTRRWCGRPRRLLAFLHIATLVLLSPPPPAVLPSTPLYHFLHARWSLRAARISSSSCPRGRCGPRCLCTTPTPPLQARLDPCRKARRGVDDATTPSTESGLDFLLCGRPICKLGVRVLCPFVVLSFSWPPAPLPRI